MKPMRSNDLARGVRVLSVTPIAAWPTPRCRLRRYRCPSRCEIWSIGYSVATFVDQYAVQDELRRRILRRFRREGIAMAIPARSVHVNGTTTTAARSDASPANAPDGGIGAG